MFYSKLGTKKQSQEKMWIAYVTTYPPRECGIATFAADLIMHFDRLFVPREEVRVAALNSEKLGNYNYPKRVIFNISEDVDRDYREAAKKLNDMKQIKLVSIQHEFGIYGKDYGKNILAFLEDIKKPVAVTFHTVLPNPPEEMKQVMDGIVERADRLIVMTESSKDLMVSVYGAPEEKIRIIPHGIHPLPYVNSRVAKSALKLSDKRVLSTFGFLSRGKGIEYGISALPEIIKKYPNTVYLIIGATHPVVLKRDGDEYRNELVSLAHKLGVENNVHFYNQYFKTPELLKLLQATDIYLSLSQNPDQAVSGTFTYALGVGRPVLSTPFMQATEVITPEIGGLLEFGDSKVLARKVIDLFDNEDALSKMGRAAYFRTRGLIWPNVALSYMGAFTEISPALAKKERILPPLKLQHLNKMTDKFGILQFAILDDPDPSWGYTLDDNARALIVASWSHDLYGGKNTERIAEIYSKFLEFAAHKDVGFENYVNFDRTFHHERNTQENLEDANARTLWALAVATSGSLPKSIRQRSERLLRDRWVCGLGIRVKSPRAAAFIIKAICSLPEEKRTEDQKKQLVEYADFLLGLYNQNSDENWSWFEEILTYSNALLPESLLLAYKETGNYLYFKAGKTSLDFLISKSFEDDVCVPVGQAGWYHRTGVKQLFDQQPEEVSALVLALRTAYEVSADRSYFERMERAFDWFLGNNLLNQVVYSHSTGGCYDGLGEKEINLNQGAESTISYLLARIIVEKPETKETAE